MQPNATKKCCFGGHLGVFNFCSCSCCSRRTPRTRCVFANATFTGGRATARSHENRSRGVVLSCRVRWHMRGGMRVPCHARAPQQREQRSRFLHCLRSAPEAPAPARAFFFVATSSEINGRKRRKSREPERTGGSSVVKTPNLSLGSAYRTPCRPLACMASPEWRNPRKKHATTSTSTQKK